MPYFPKPGETTYICRGCGGRFIPSNISCLVQHPPGTCCHYGETRADCAEIVHQGTKWPPEIR